MDNDMATTSLGLDQDLQRPVLDRQPATTQQRTVSPALTTAIKPRPPANPDGWDNDAVRYAMADAHARLPP